MEVKNKSFFALSRIERATKLFILLCIFILMNCSTVFASKATEGLDYVLNKESDFTSFMETEEYTDVINILENYDNVVIYKYYSTVTFLYIYSTNGSFIKQANGQFKSEEQTNFTRIYRYSDSGLWTYRTQNSNNGMGFVPTEILFTSDSIFDWEGNEVLPPTDTYKSPYYEITLDYKGESSIQANGKKVKAYTYDSIYDTGITTIGNKFLKVGYLYIDDNYIISNLLTSVPIMTKYNMNLLNNWEYTLYEGIYTTGEKENGYLKYEIRIPIEYVTTPNYYNIFFRSRDTEIQEDININFVLLNNTENSGTIGPIITPSGDIISGDAIKDETTLGDIINSITEPYDPNKNILNNMTSGDLLNSMGYNENIDPNEDVWKIIIDGLKETLTGSGDVILTTQIRGTEIEINSKDIKQPESQLKKYTGLFTNFWLLMQMLTFIKRTIDDINEGNLKVMHDIDADCYFF